MQYIPVGTIKDSNELRTAGPTRIAQPLSVKRKIIPKMTLGDGDS